MKSHFALRGCHLVYVVGACLLVGSLSGCGNQTTGGAKLVPVVGKVKLGDKPLTRGSVSFRPDASKGNTTDLEPAGDIDAQGNYTLFTNGQKGAPLGWYKVSVVATEEPDPRIESAAPRSLIPSKYNEANTSGISKEIVAQLAPGAYDITLAPK